MYSNGLIKTPKGSNLCSSSKAKPTCDPCGVVCSETQPNYIHGTPAGSCENGTMNL